MSSRRCQLTVTSSGAAAALYKCRNAALLYYWWQLFQKTSSSQLLVDHIACRQCHLIGQAGQCYTAVWTPPPLSLLHTLHSISLSVIVSDTLRDTLREDIKTFLGYRHLLLPNLQSKILYFLANFLRIGGILLTVFRYIYFYSAHAI